MVEVGSVSVPVVPDGSTFATRIAGILRNVPDSVTVAVEFAADQQQVTKLTNEAVAKAQNNIKPIQLNYQGNKAGAVAAMAGDLAAAKAVQPKFNLKYEASLAGIKKSLASDDLSKKIEIPISANTAKARLEIDKLSGKNIKLDVNVDRPDITPPREARRIGGNAGVQLENFSRTLDNVKNIRRDIEKELQKIKIDPTVDTSHLDELMARLNILAATTKNIKVALHIEQALEGYQLLRARYMEEVKLQGGSIHLGYHIEEAINKLKVFSDFYQKTKREQERDEPTLKLNIERALEELTRFQAEASARGINVDVDANLEFAAAHLQEFKIRETNKEPINVDTDLDLKGAAIHLSEFIARNSRRNINIDVDMNTSALGAAGNALGALLKSSDAAAEGMQTVAGTGKAMSDALQGAATVGSNVVSTFSSVGSKFIELGAGAVASTAALVEETVATGGLNLVLIAGVVAIGAVVAVMAGWVFELGLAATASAVLAAAAVITAAVMAAMATAAVVLGGAIAALPGVIGAAVGAIGVLAIAFMPVIKAIQAYMSMQNAADKGVAKANKATLQQQRTIRGLKEARDAANAAELKAGADVSKARQEAVKDLERLKKAVLDANDAQKAANRTAAEAALNQAQVAADPTATLEDRMRAEDGLNNALDGVSGAARTRVQAEQDLTEAQRKGISGSDKVVAANERLAAAHVAAARAQRAVTEAIADSKTALDTGSTQAQAYDSALGKLSAAGKELVGHIIDLINALNPLAQRFQTLAFPGIIAVVDALIALIKNPNISSAFDDMAAAISNVAGQFANMLKDPKVISDIAQMVSDGATAISNFGGPAVSLLKDIIDAFAQIGHDAQPVLTAIAQGFQDAGPAIKIFFDAFSDPKVISGIVDGMKGLFGIINGAFAILGPFVAKLAEIGGPWLDKVKGPLLDLFQQFLNLLEQLMSPQILSAFTTLVSSLADSFTVLVQSGVINDLSKGFADIVTQLAPMIPMLVEQLVPVLPLLIQSFVDLTVAFVNMLPTIIPAIPVFLQIVAVLVTATTAVTNLVTMFIWAWEILFGHSIIPDMVDAFSYYFGLVKDIIDGVRQWIEDKFNAVIDFFAGLPKRIGDATAGMWDGLKNGFIAVLDIIIDAWNRLDFAINITVPDWVPAIGGKGFKVDDIFPDIPRLAGGGIVTQPTIALIGEAGPEAVTPLSQFGALANFLGQSSNLNTNSGGGTVKNFIFNQNGDINQNVDADMMLQKFQLLSMGM